MMDFMVLQKIVCLAIVFVNNVLEDLIQNVRSDTMILTYKMDSVLGHVYATMDFMEQVTTANNVI